MISTLNKKFIALASALLVVALEGATLAMSVPASAGKAWQPTSLQSLTCPEESSAFRGSIKNVCSDRIVTWAIPLAVNQGTKQVLISGVATSTPGSLFCDVFVHDQNGNVASNTTLNFPVGTSIQSTTMTVPASGTLMVRCFIGFNAMVHSVNYDQ